MHSTSELPSTSTSASTFLLFPPPPFPLAFFPLSFPPTAAAFSFLTLGGLLTCPAHSHVATCVLRRLVPVRASRPGDTSPPCERCAACAASCARRSGVALAVVEVDVDVVEVVEGAAERLRGEGERATGAAGRSDALRGDEPVCERVRARGVEGAAGGTGGKNEVDEVERPARAGGEIEDEVEASEGETEPRAAAAVKIV